MDNRFLFLMFCPLLALNAVAVCQSRLEVQDGNYCFKEANWSFHGVLIGDSLSDVEKLLGRPDSIREIPGEDDGGPYIDYRRSYGPLEVDIVRGVVDRLFSSSPWSTPKSGVRVGSPADSVFRLLGLPSTYEIDSTGTVAFTSCYWIADNGEQYSNGGELDLHFSSARLLESIEILTLRP